MKSFLLRFEEATPCLQAVPSLACSQPVIGLSDSVKRRIAIVAGTKTFTEVLAEGTDSDPREPDELAFPK